MDANHRHWSKVLTSSVCVGFASHKKKLCGVDVDLPKDSNCDVACLDTDFSNAPRSADRSGWLLWLLKGG